MEVNVFCKTRKRKKKKGQEKIQRKMRKEIVLKTRIIPNNADPPS